MDRKSPRRGAVASAAVSLCLVRGVAAQCVTNVSAGFNAQVGITGAYVQECNEGEWVGLAFPFFSGGAPVDTVRFSLNTNRGGGDVYVMADTGNCNPDTGNILAGWCCGLEGLSINMQPATHNLHDLVAPAPIATSATQPTWIVFVQRTGSAGQNAQGIPNGGSFPSHSLARDGTQPSIAGRAFANIVGTGGDGDWVDVVTLNPSLGTPYDATLLVTGGAPSAADNCANAPAGACCNDDPGCTILRPWECGIAGGLYNGNGTGCADPPVFECTCGEGAGNCWAADSTPGCNQLSCCKVVCLADPTCCELEWDLACVTIALLPANVVVCSIIPPLPPAPLTNRFAEGNGRLAMRPDAFGSWTSATFGGHGDSYNPGPPAAAGSDPEPREVAFATGTYLFIDRDNDGTNDARELLSTLTQYESATPDDNTLLTQILAPGSASDTNGDLAFDTETSSFRVLSPDLAVDVTFSVLQQVSDAGGDAARYDLTYTISNNTASAVTLKLVRHLDADLAFEVPADPNYPANDSVGTDANLSDVHYGVFQQEFAEPSTRVHITDPTAEVYAGNKGGIDPDPGDPVCAAYGFGIDVIFWNAFGITGGSGATDCWADNIALLGTGIDGESGTGSGNPACNPCDGMILLEQVVTVPAGPGPAVVVSFRNTYGVPCPGDCQAVPDGSVGINDLLDLLAEWGAPGRCDLDGAGVGITDLLALLAAWGVCP